MKTKIILTIAIYLFISFEIILAETFRSRSTAMITKDSADIKTKTLYWWNDWTLTLPNSELTIQVTPRRITINNASKDVYTLQKRHFYPALVKGEKGAVLVYYGTDQAGKVWTVTVCRDADSIYSILIEDKCKMIMYQ